MRYFFLSVFLHALLVMGFSWRVVHLDEGVLLHSSSLRSVSSRAAFSAGPSALDISIVKTLGPALKAARDDRALSARDDNEKQKHTSLRRTLATSPHTHFTAEKTAASQKKSDPFLQLLHDAIAEHQDYPESALALNQTGTVTLRFMLSPDGSVSQVAILKSSGFASMDEAALLAVQSIVPVKASHDYLHEPKAFSIDVTFEA